jgi:hypothetical protein
LLGFLIILSEKIETGQSIIPHSFHSMLGVFSIFVICVQIIVGQQRIDQSSYNPSFRRWHNDCGLFLWDLLCFTIFIGLITFVPFGFLKFFLLLLPWFVWLCIYAQFYSRTNRHDEIDRAAEDEEDGSNVSKPLSNNFGSNANLAVLESGANIALQSNEQENAEESSAFLTSNQQDDTD